MGFRVHRALGFSEYFEKPGVTAANLPSHTLREGLGASG